MMASEFVVKALVVSAPRDVPRSWRREICMGLGYTGWSLVGSGFSGVGKIGLWPRSSVDRAVAF